MYTKRKVLELTILILKYYFINMMIYIYYGRTYHSDGYDNLLLLYYYPYACLFLLLHPCYSYARGIVCRTNLMHGIPVSCTVIYIDCPLNSSLFC